MASEDRKPVHLHRIDPARNMRRFYGLALQPTLFGGVSVIRAWGRIGTEGRTLVETFDAPEAAEAVLDRLARRKRRRGYREAGPAAEG